MNYHGVMVEQTLEPTDTKVPAFTALAETTGVTVWGYRYGEPTTGVMAVEAAPEYGKDYLFDLQGRKMTGTLKPGLYIRNGKKVMIK